MPQQQQLSPQPQVQVPLNLLRTLHPNAQQIVSRPLNPESPVPEINSAKLTEAMEEISKANSGPKPKPIAEEQQRQQQQDIVSLSAQQNKTPPIPSIMKSKSFQQSLDPAFKRQVSFSTVNESLPLKKRESLRPPLQSSNIQQYEPSPHKQIRPQTIQQPNIQVIIPPQQSETQSVSSRQTRSKLGELPTIDVTNLDKKSVDQPSLSQLDQVVGDMDDDDDDEYDYDLKDLREKVEKEDQEEAKDVTHQLSKQNSQILSRQESFKNTQKENVVLQKSHSHNQYQQKPIFKKETSPIIEQSEEDSKSMSTYKSYSALERRLKALEEKIVEKDAVISHQQCQIESLNANLLSIFEFLQIQPAATIIPNYNTSNNGQNTSLIMPTVNRVNSGVTDLTSIPPELRPRRSNYTVQQPKTTRYQSKNSGSGGQNSEEDELNDDTSTLSDGLDIAFLNAEVLVKRKTTEDGTFLVSMRQSQQLSATVMYKQILDVLQRTEKQYSIYKNHLNPENLTLVCRDERPKILIINCHGGYIPSSLEEDRLRTYFCFEDNDHPCLMHKMTENDLIHSVRNSGIQLVIISACHSSQLGEKFKEAGIPVVVCISASDQVYEKAAEKFNKIFLQSLLNGQNPETAFETSLSVLRGSKENSGICCCSHDHTDNCLWKKYREKYGEEKAHQIHSDFSCKCSIKEGFGPIDHTLQCKSFENFSNQLLKTGNDEEQESVYDENGKDGFLQPAGCDREGKHGDRHQMCCCHTDWPHDETEKFLLLGDKDDIKKPIKGLIKTKDGDVIKKEPLDLKKCPRWLVKESNRLQDRNLMIHDVVEFLLCDNMRLLTIYGDQMNGRSSILEKSIKIAIEHKPDIYKNKHSDLFYQVYQIDLGNKPKSQQTKSQICSEIVKVLSLQIQEPSIELIGDELRDKKMLLYFKDCKMLKEEENVRELFSLIRRFNTITQQSVKTVVILNKKPKFQQYDTEQLLEIPAFSLEGKINFFISQIKANQQEWETILKQHGRELRYSKLFENIKDIQHLYLLSKDFKNMDQLEQKVTEYLNFERKQREEDIQKENKKKFEREMTRQHSQISSFDDSKSRGSERNSDKANYNKTFVAMSLLDSIPQDSKIEINLIYLLALLPAGLAKTDIEAIFSIYQTWFDDNKIVQKIEARQSQTFKQLDIIESYLDLFEVIQCPEIDETIIKVNDIYRNTIQELFLAQINTDLTVKGGGKRKRTQLVAILIEYLGSLARTILRSIKSKENSGVTDYRLVTVHIDQGMWYRYPNEEYSIFNEEVEFAEQKFSAYLQENFYYILNTKFLDRWFGDLWNDKTTYEQEYTTDLCLTVPSILVMINRHEQAIEIIKIFRKFGKGRTLFMHAKLDLILASIYIYKNYPIEAEKVLSLVEKAQEGFYRFGTPVDADSELQTTINQEGFYEGLAETKFTEAQLYIRLYRNFLIHEDQRKEQQESLLNQEFQIKHQHSVMYQNQLPLKHLPLSHQLLGQETKMTEIEKNHLFSSEFDRSNLLSQIFEALENSYKNFTLVDNDFDGIEETYMSNKEFGKAKTYLAEADFIIDNFDRLKRSSTFEKDFDDLLSTYSNNKQEYISKLGQAFEYFHKSSKIWQQKTQTQNEEKSLSCEIKCKSYKNYAAIALKLQAQIMIHQTSEKEVITPDIFMEARDKIEQALTIEVDHKIQTEINKIKNIIINELKQDWRKLFTIAKAQTLLYHDLDDNRLKVCGDYIPSRYQLPTKLLQNFKEQQLDLQIKFACLNEQLFEEVCESGTRVLHLTSEYFLREALIIEDELGLAKEIHRTEIKEYFKAFKRGPNFKNKQPLDVIVLAIPESGMIGQEFANLGIDHVIAFSEIEMHESYTINDVLMPIRYNYIYCFCQKFYSYLVDQSQKTPYTVREAFKKTLKYLQDPKILQSHVWLKKDQSFQSLNLGIKPLLINESSPIHDKPLFNISKLKGDAQFIKKGEVYNITERLGLRDGIQKSSEPYIGNQHLIYNVCQNLTNQEHQRHLVHIRGKKGQGKTRLLHEIGLFLHRRRYFSDKVQYQDLETIKSNQEFKDMLDKKNLYDQEKLENVLILFDNVDRLPKEIERNFESRLFDLLRHNPKIRFITTSTKKFKFEQFVKGKSCLDTERLHQTPKTKQYKFIIQEIKPFDETEMVQLLLTTSSRMIDYENEVDLRDVRGSEVLKRLVSEPQVQKLDNNPTNIIKFAMKLQNTDFLNIQVSGKSDKMKNYSGHHKAKAQDIVKIKQIGGVDKSFANSSQKEEEELKVFDSSFANDNESLRMPLGEPTEDESLFFNYDQRLQLPFQNLQADDIRNSRRSTVIELVSATEQSQRSRQDSYLESQQEFQEIGDFTEEGFYDNTQVDDTNQVAVNSIAHLNLISQELQKYAKQQDLDNENEENWSESDIHEEEPSDQRERSYSYSNEANQFMHQQSMKSYGKQKSGPKQKQNQPKKQKSQLEPKLTKKQLFSKTKKKYVIQIIQSRNQQIQDSPQKEDKDPEAYLKELKLSNDKSISSSPSTLTDQSGSFSNKPKRQSTRDKKKLEKQQNYQDKHEKFDKF